MKKILLAILFLAVVPSLQARTAAFRVWVANPMDSVRWNLRDSSAIVQTGLATLDSSNYFAYWNVVIDDTTSYTLQATYWRTGLRQVSACIPLQLVYTDAIDSLKYALWLPQPIDSLRWTTRSATGTAHTGLANVDSSDYYVWWMVPVDSANRYLHNANFWWDGATRPVSDIENLIPYGSGSSSGFTITDSTAIARWVWTLFDTRTVLGGGTGAYSYIVNFLDTSTVPDAVQSQIAVRVNNVAQTGDIRENRTDIYGNTTFQLDSGQYVAFTTDPRFVQNIDTFTVSDTGRYIFRNAPAVLIDTDTNTTTIAFVIKRPDGTPNDSAEINIELRAVHDSLLSFEDNLVSASYRQMVIRADANGRAVLGLYANELFTNDSSYYQATVKNRYNDRLIDQFKFRVPAVASPAADTVHYIHNLPRWKR